MASMSAKAPPPYWHLASKTKERKRKKQMFSVVWKMCPPEEGEEQSVCVPGYATAPALDWYSSMSPHFMNNKFLC